MFLGIKLIKLNENGKAMIPPCFLDWHLEFNVLAYMETYNFVPSSVAELQVTVTSLLRVTTEMFGCPLGFKLMNPVTMEVTKEQFYDLKNDSIEIDWTMHGEALFNKGLMK